MRAVVYDTYGPPDVLRLEDVEQPVPKADEVLIKIHATTVNRTDCAGRAAKPFISRLVTGLRRPRRHILGSELAGEVEAVGHAVSEAKEGDQLLGSSRSLLRPPPALLRAPASAPLRQRPARL